MKFFIFLATLFLAASCTPETEEVPRQELRTEDAGVDLSPTQWPAEDLQRFRDLELVDFPGNPAAKGHGGAISGSYHPFAQRAG